MVSRTHLTETILPDMNARVKTKLKEQLKNFKHLSVTTDMWTSDSSSNINDFISLTAHGVDNEFQLKSFCLEVWPFEGDAHTGEQIARNMRSIFQEWEIVDQASAVITDNARNMRKSIEDLGLDVDHISCIVHSLQLTLKTCIFDQEQIAQLLTACRGIVTHVSHSTSAVKKLKSSQRSTNLPEHVLIQDVQTRWDSTHQMLKGLYEQRLAIQDLLPSIVSMISRRDNGPLCNKF